MIAQMSVRVILALFIFHLVQFFQVFLSFFYDKKRQLGKLLHILYKNPSAGIGRQGELKIR
jgi:hypothetical protein